MLKNSTIVVQFCVESDSACTNLCTDMCLSVYPVQCMYLYTAMEFTHHLSSCSRLDRVHLRRYHEYSEREALRPGVTRLSFPYFMSDEAVEYVIKSVSLIARHGWILLPQVCM